MLLLLIILTIGCMLSLYMIKEAFANRIIEHEFVFPDLPAGFDRLRIFFISDIHRRVISPKLMANMKAKPDIVIIGGDLAEKGVPIKRVEKNLQTLKTLAPVYFVWGNNDYELNRQQFIYVLQQCNIKILANTASKIHSPFGEKLAFIGVEDMLLGREQLDLALASAVGADFNILVCHNPRIVHHVLLEQSIRLILCGHTHGGQIHIFGYSPYEKGSVKSVGNTTVLISNGYGTTALPLRLGAKSETHMIELRRG